MSGSMTRYGGKLTGQGVTIQEDYHKKEPFRKKESEERVSLPQGINRTPTLSPVPNEKRGSLYNISPERSHFIRQEQGFVDLNSTSGKKSSDIHIRELGEFHSKPASIHSVDE